MKKYYLHDGQHQHGPYSLEELRDRSLTKNTPVWTSDLPDWTKAGEIPALKELFLTAPPPFVKELKTTSAHKAGYKIGKLLGISGIIIFVISATAVIVYRSQHTKNGSSQSLVEQLVQKEKTPEELRLELAQKEKTNPTEYLVETITMRKNLIGETIFEGSVMNNASVATFKDIVLEISYLSKTQAVISTKQFTIYEVAAPGKWASFKFRTIAPSETKGFSARVVTAVPVEAVAF